jgi:hypothetical protein
MTSYVVTGHPLNYANLDLPTAVRAVIQAAQVGATINLTLTGPDDAKAKGHGVLK